MKKVNLLPAWYIKQKHERSRLRVRVALLFCGVLTLAAWITFQKSHIAMLQARYDTLTKQAAELHRVDGDLAAARQDLAQAESLRAAYRELGPTVPMSTLLQQIHNDMEKGMALSRVSVDIREETPRRAGPIDTRAPQPKPRPMARIVAIGLSPNDVGIATLIGRLSNNPLFSEVTLNYSRAEVVQDYSARRFEIQMVMDLSRLHAEDSHEPQTAALR